MGVVVGGRGRCRLQGWGVAGRVHYSLAPAILRPVGGEEKIAKHEENLKLNVNKIFHQIFYFVQFFVKNF